MKKLLLLAFFGLFLAFSAFSQATTLSTGVPTTSTQAQNGQYMAWDSLAGTWKPKTISPPTPAYNTAFGINGSNIRITDGGGSLDLPIVSVAPVQSILAGTAMSVSGTTGAWTITNTSPDQIVAITGAGGNVVTGTYPNFLITAPAPDGDGSATNEGSLTVAAGTSTTSVINSNTSGSTGITLQAGFGVTLAETGTDIITISTTSATLTVITASTSGQAEVNAATAGIITGTDYIWFNGTSKQRQTKI